VDLVHGCTMHRLQKGQGVRDLSRSSRIGRLWMRARDQEAADASGPLAVDLMAASERRECTGDGGARRSQRRTSPTLLETELESSV
jgi:hypothetical protein